MRKILLLLVITTTLAGCSLPSINESNNLEQNPAKKSLIKINPQHFKKVSEKEGKYSLDVNIPESTMTLSSPDFENETQIPAKFTCDGEKLLPTLKISGIPENTKSLVLIASSPRGELPKFVHGTFWDIPANTTEINAKNSRDFLQGINDFETKEYVAPCPEKGNSEEYLFELWALDKNITSGNLDWTAGHLMVNSLGHILGKSVLKTSYAR